MAGFDNDVVYANNADFSTAGAGTGSASNGLQLNGQLWIGSTAANVGGTHVNVGHITGSGGITVTNGAGTIDIAAAVVVPTTYNADTGSATPVANILVLAGSGSITTSAAGNTVTTALTGLTNHNVLIGAGTATITKVAPSATSGLPLVSQGAAADPAFGTAVVAGGGTGATTLTNHGVLIGQGTSAVAATSAGSAGQVLQSSGAAADPVYSTATYPSVATGSGTILRANGTNWVASTATYPNTTTTGDLIYASASNVFSTLTASSNPGVPLISLGASTAPEWLNPQTDIFLYDDFISGSGSLGNTGFVTNNQNGGSAFGGGVGNVTGHPGVMVANTGAATNGANCVGHNSAITTGDGRTLHTFLMQIPTLSDGTDTYIARVGLQEVGTATGDITNGCYFEYTHSVNSGNWTIKTANNGTRTTANSSTTVDTNWHLYAIDINAAGTSVSFYVDGSEVANSPITTNIPGNTRFFSDGWRISKSAGTNTRTLYIDFSMLWKKMTSNRY